jgi:hypothetical protein
LLTAGKGTILEGDLEIHWKVAKADEDDSRMVRTVDYTISGPEGESYGGLRDQDDADGHPETEFYYVDQHGSGFAWTTGITYNHDLKCLGPAILNATKSVLSPITSPMIKKRFVLFQEKAGRLKWYLSRNQTLRNYYRLTQVLFLSLGRTTRDGLRRPKMVRGTRTVRTIMGLPEPSVA